MTSHNPLRGVFVFSLTTLVCLAGGFLAWADGSFLPVGLTIPVAIAAYVFCEQLQWFQVGPLGANILGVIGFVVAAAEFFGDSPEGKLLAGAHLICYLQWILLVQKKEDSQYWWNIVLSILQIALCAVLTKNIWFGLWFIGYVSVILWTLAVYWMFVAESQFRQAENVTDDQISTNSHGTISAQGKWSTAHQVQNGTDSNRVPTPSSITHAIQLDAGLELIASRFLGGIAALTFAVVICGGAIFALIPRLWAQQGGVFSEFTASAVRGSMPGFSKEVSLNDVTSNVDNPRTAFKVKMSEANSTNPVDIELYARELGMEEPLFRGAVLTNYHSGTWSHAENQDPLSVWGLNRRDSTKVIGNLPGVIQLYEMEPADTNVIFSMGAVWAGAPVARDHFELRFDRISHELHYVSEEQLDRFSYRILTPRSAALVSNPSQTATLSLPIQETMAIPDNLKKLQALAWEIVGETPDPERPRWRKAVLGRGFRLPPGKDRERTRKIVAYLSQNPEFQYSLTALTKDPLIDPVEDFLFNRKSGHCEYYASALALLLRSVNVPSRVITGFKGGTVSDQDKSLTVYHRNAHAWVEAYLQDRWVAFDPTPVSTLPSAQKNGFNLWEHTQRFVSDTWNIYVLNMSIEDQSGIAVPLWQAILNRLNQSLGGGKIVDFFTWALEVISSPSRLFSLQGGFLLLSIGATLLALRYSWIVIKWLGGKLFISLKSGEPSRSPGVEFYEKFLRLMAHHGLRPFPWQTQQEFTTSSLSRLPISTQTQGSLGSLIVNCFYQIRFGGMPVPLNTQHQIQQQIDQLDSDLKISQSKTSLTQPASPPN